ncbi:MAG TPA: hypothetical protein VFK05_06390 [Polyangiaceae bacterium]|nr:hypothetical protein [Polyangiaceae bacterium]
MTRRATTLLLAASIGLGAFFGTLKSIEACRCVEPNAPVAMYRSADAVVVAKVVKRDRRPDIDGFTLSLFVERAWKSEIDQEVLITTGTDCQYAAEPERKHLMFLTRAAPPVFTTGKCMGNRPLDEATKLIDWLEANAKQAAVIPPSCESCHPGFP